MGIGPSPLPTKGSSPPTSQTLMVMQSPQETLMEQSLCVTSPLARSTILWTGQGPKPWSKDDWYPTKP